jgi:hypothetical protein
MPKPTNGFDQTLTRPDTGEVLRVRYIQESTDTSVSDPLSWCLCLFECESGGYVSVCSDELEAWNYTKWQA